MEQYIDKSALVAEIKRRKSQFMSQADSFHKLGMEEKRDHFAILASNMHSILSFIDTLEVKEVKEPAASDKGMAEEIIINLKRVESDYHIDLTREMEWLRSKA